MPGSFRDVVLTAFFGVSGRADSVLGVSTAAGAGAGCATTEGLSGIPIMTLMIRSLTPAVFRSMRPLVVRSKDLVFADPILAMTKSSVNAAFRRSMTS